MKLVCGLGNPGAEYAGHRHNIGFRVVETLAERAGASFGKERFQGRFAQGRLGSEKVLLLMPQTFMNLSGRSLGEAARFFKIAPSDTLVVHDELDLPFGRLQLKSGGGPGGHNGLKSIIAQAGGPGFDRLRFGVGKPSGEHARERVVSWVLSAFEPEEQRALGDLIEQATDAAEAWVREGMGPAANRFNRRA